MGKKKKEISPKMQKINTWITMHLGRISYVEKIFFVDHLRTMLHAGLSLVEAIVILEKETENKKFSMIITGIKNEVEQGQTFSDVLAHYPKAFPPIYVKMISAGEIAGKLEESLEQIVVQMQKNHDLASSIRGAMIYPAVVITAMLGVAILMVTVILPKLLAIFKDFDTELPLATKILITITDFASSPLNLTIIVVTLTVFIALYIYLLKNVYGFKRFMHNVTLHLPIFGKVIKQINLARFSLTLSSLLKSTVPIMTAVEITADTCSNVLYKDSLIIASQTIQQGTPLSEILRTYNKLFPPMVTEMIMVGERTGEIGHMLNELSDFFSKAVDKTMKNFTTIIEPVIILALGVAVAGMAVAVIMPMYSLVQNF